jgi:hypothetical protein
MKRKLANPRPCSTVLIAKYNGCDVLMDGDSRELQIVANNKSSAARPGVSTIVGFLSI